MSYKYLVLISSLLIILVFGSYGWFFSDGVIVADNNGFGTFGDFIGGILNPLLSFIVIVMLSKDLMENKRANDFDRHFKHFEEFKKIYSEAHEKIFENLDFEDDRIYISDIQTCYDKLIGFDLAKNYKIKESAHEAIEDFYETVYDNLTSDIDTKKSFLNDRTAYWELFDELGFVTVQYAELNVMNLEHVIFFFRSVLFFTNQHKDFEDIINDILHELGKLLKKHPDDDIVLIDLTDYL